MKNFPASCLLSLLLASPGLLAQAPDSSALPLSYYIEPGSYGTKRETDPPDYVRPAAQVPGLERLGWLNLGWDSRMRGEWRHNDLRRPPSQSDDFPLLLRQRLYLGIVEALDPLRLVVELEDARRNNGQFPLDDRDVNQMELIQGFAELRWAGGLGKDPRGNPRPLSLRAGRMAFEFLDRRLIALNRWRNTTNTFDGLRLALGQDANDWQVDALAFFPVNRELYRLDAPDQNRQFLALIGHWRGHSPGISIEPHYMGLLQQAAPSNNNRARSIHGFGLRLYGWDASRRFNYDLTGMYQIGQDNGLRHRAQAFTAELGHTWRQSPYRPRLSAFLGYASGDRDPNDAQNQRFERFFGFARPWSANDYIVMENILTPKLKIEWQQRLGRLRLRGDAGYSFYWLASPRDRFVNLLAGSSANRDPNGQSGTFLGHELDARLRFSPITGLDVDLGYARFAMGDFVRARQMAANNGSAERSDFLYLELSLNWLDLLAAWP